MLRKQSGNMYEFVSHTWNVLKGKCPHDCSYCYMKKFKLKALRFDEKELKTDLGEDNFIFVGNSTDMFAKGVPFNWVKRVLEHCSKFPTNKYLFQSKNPKKFYEFLHLFPEKIVLGTTIESNRDYGISNAPTCFERAGDMGALSTREIETIVTIEPILKFDHDKLLALIKLANPTWVNIGADSKGHGLPEPTKEEVERLSKAIAEETEVKLKSNLKRLIGTE